MPPMHIQQGLLAITYSIHTQPFHPVRMHIIGMPLFHGAAIYSLKKGAQSEGPLQCRWLLCPIYIWAAT